MAALRLQPPTRHFHSLALDVVTVNPASLYRVSGQATGEPYFGRSNANRFDDPSRTRARRCGTCYLGLSFKVAFAESVLHDIEPASGGFAVPDTEITRRFAYAFHGPDLRLANLTGTSLLILGGNGELSGASNYRLPRKWSMAVAAHPANVDGFVYMSRRVNDSAAIVLFERDKTYPHAMQVSNCVPLDQHPDFAAAMRDLNVQPEY